MAAKKRQVPRVARKVLVHGDTGLSGILADMLFSHGYEVGTASDADAAVGMHARSRFDALLIDWEGDGEECVRRIKEFDGRDCLIILMLGPSSSFHFETPVSGYLVKPFSVNDVMERLSRRVPDGSGDD